MPKIYRLEKRDQAVELRKQGKSLRFIAKELEVSLSTTQIWTKQVILTDEQKQDIKRHHQKKLFHGRDSYNKERLLQRTKAETKISVLSKTEFKERKSDAFFTMGLALYWAEGFKKDHSLGFVNSDPVMLKLFLMWLQKYGNASLNDVRLRVQIHEVYKPLIKEIECYWSQYLHVPLSQFQKPFYQVSKSNVSKVDQNYRGLVRIRVVGTRKLFVKILGWIEALKTSGL